MQFGDYSGCIARIFGIIWPNFSRVPRRQFFQSQLIMVAYMLNNSVGPLPYLKENDIWNKLEELDQVPWRTLCLFSAFPPPIDLGRNPSNVQCQHCFKNVRQT